MGLMPPASRHSGSYWVFVTVSGRASWAAVSVSRVSSVSVLNYSQLHRDKTCHCLLLHLTMLDWTTNIFSFFQTNVEIKRELRYCDGFKCKSIYFIPQVCVNVKLSLTSLSILMSGKTPGQLEPVPCVTMLPVWDPGLWGTVHWRQHRLGLPGQQDSPPR